MTELGKDEKIPFKVWGFSALEKGEPMAVVRGDKVEEMQNPEYKPASLRIRINDKITYNFDEDDIREIKKWLSVIALNQDSAPSPTAEQRSAAPSE